MLKRIRPEQELGNRKLKKNTDSTSSFKQAYSFTTSLVIAGDTYELDGRGRVSTG